MHDKVLIKLLTEEAKIPQKATEFSSGYDLFSTEDCLLKKGSYRLISTGISIAMEKGMEAQVRPRSGLAIKYGITVLNAPGTIDADYRGEVKVALINLSEADFAIEKGMRVAQMVFAEVADINLVEADDLSATLRGEGGFGSTGLN